MKTEVTQNDLVIQGLFKEAYFHETPIVFEGIHREIKIKLKIAEFIESKIRDLSKNKKLCFYFYESSEHQKQDFFELQQSYAFSFYFHRSRIQGEMTCVQVDPTLGLIYFTFPERLQIKNLRKEDRTAVVPEVSQPVSVILRTQSIHAEGSFELLDTSSHGWGGTLKVPHGFPIEVGTGILGHLGVSQKIGEIRGKITAVYLSDSLNKNDRLDVYRIGVESIVLIDQNGGPSKESRNERRQQSRYPTQMQLTLESLLHPEQTLYLEVNNISVNGFSGSRLAGSVTSGVPLGSVFRLENQKSTVQLIAISKDRLHFKFLKRTQVEGLDWIKKMTPLINPFARSKTQDTKELYRIFLQAGAVSHQYLKRHQIHHNILVSSEHHLKNESAYLHRWFIGSGSTQADGYISAMRVGNSSWVMGDIAKTQDSALSMKHSIQQFFMSFSEYAQSEPSIGTMMIFWVKQHPLWMDWYQRLMSRYSDLIVADVRMFYYRVPALAFDQKTSPLFEMSEIKKNDYSIRSHILNQVGDGIKKVLCESFDFTDSGTGSFVYSESVASFERRYFYLQSSAATYLAIVNRIEMGVSINRFMESLFLFPLKGSQLHSNQLLWIAGKI
jgi:hypothetical protein